MFGFKQMPWKLEKSGAGYFVVTKDTGRRHSKMPLPKQRALAQMRALYANEKYGPLKAGCCCLSCF
jgi:hypothetical protein